MEESTRKPRRIIGQKHIVKGPYGVDSLSHLLTLIRDHGFPAPIKYGGANRWDENEILDWIERQAEARFAAAE